ncbi:MAG: copper resistance CopC family protein [Mycobacteriaceae bacterium]
MMRSWLRAAGVALALGVALLAGVGPASAHSYLVSSDPADGVSLTAGPPQVNLTFNEQLQTSFDSISVVGPDGNRWSTGDTKVAGAKVSIALTELGPVGKYTVAYRVVSADSHPVAGTVAFTLSTAGNGTPGPKAGSAQSPGATGGSAGGVSAWPFVLGAVLVFGVGIAVVVRSSKRRRV